MPQSSTPHTALWNSSYVSAASLAPAECIPDDHWGISPVKNSAALLVRSALPLEEGDLSCPIRKFPHRTWTVQPPEKSISVLLEFSFFALILPFNGKIEAVSQTPLKHQPVICHWTPCLAFRLTLGFPLNSGPCDVSKGSPSQKEKISCGWFKDPQTEAQKKPRIQIIIAQGRNDVSLRLNFSTSKAPLIVSLLDHACMGNILCQE